MSTPLKNSERNNLKAERVGSGWSWRLFLFSFLVIIGVVVVYAGLEYGYKPFLINQITRQDSAISTLSDSISSEDETSLVGFYSQAANLKLLLDRHISTSQVLPFLESVTNAQVYFDAVELRARDRRLDVSGIAASYEALSQQLEAFNRSPMVESMVINESQKVGNKVSFRVYLILQKELFQ